jgi:hypothetical protein
MQQISKISLWLAVLGLTALSSQGQYMLADWQDESSGDGWINWQGAQPSVTNSPVFSFVTGAVPGCTQSLQLTQGGWNQTLAIKLENNPPDQAAFFTNQLFSLTWAVPAGTGGGYEQMWGLYVNAGGGYGFTGPLPGGDVTVTGGGETSGTGSELDFWSGSPIQTQTVTWNYSSILPALLADGNNGSGGGYVELILVNNSGGGAPGVYYFDHATLSQVVTTTNVNLLGSFQGSSDPTDAGWGDWGEAGNPAILATVPTNDDQYGFVAGVVPGYPYSLEVAPSNPGYSQNLALWFTPSQIAAFLTNSYLTFTFSAPGPNTTSGGYSQIYQVIIDAPNWGWTALPWDLSPTGEPVFDFGYGGSATQTATVTIDYSSILSTIGANPGYIHLIFISESGGGAPANYYMNNVELSTGPYGAQAAPPSPRLSIQKASPSLRIFAGSTVNWYDREELVTLDQSQSWVGGSYPVSYSFTLTEGAQYPGFQTQIFLVPVNTIPGGAIGSGPGTGTYNNEYIDYQASNDLWLDITNVSGTSTVMAHVLWKTNLPNANPNNVELTITNPTTVGTWTLTFNSVSNGTLTAPGAAGPASFTIKDTNVAADFADPMVACFGLQPQSTKAFGLYNDYTQISTVNVAGGGGSAISDNFTTDTEINTGIWALNDSGYMPSLVLVTASDPLWVSWTFPAIGFGLGVAPTLSTPNPYGDFGADTNAFVLPESYNGYYDIPVTVNQGGTNWTLIPSDCLPSSQYPNLMNAYFELFNPPPAN